MRIVNPGQFLTGLQLEMTKKELSDWLHLRMRHPAEVVSDEGSQKIKRHFYIVQGQPIVVYELPEQGTVPEEHREWHKIEA